MTDKMSEPRFNSITCECGAVVGVNYLLKHQQTKKHFNLLKKMELVPIKTELAPSENSEIEDLQAEVMTMQLDNELLINENFNLKKDLEDLNYIREFETFRSEIKKILHTSKHEIIEYELGRCLNKELIKLFYTQRAARLNTVLAKSMKYAKPLSISNNFMIMRWHRNDLAHMTS